MKRIGIAIWLMGSVQLGFGQHHVNSWFKAAVVWPINHRFKTEVEFHHRRQNGFGNSNLFYNPLMFLGRLWVHYQPHQQLALSVSPWAEFINYKVVQTKTDETQRPTQETRFAAALAWRKPFCNKWQLQARTMGEYRIFKDPSLQVTRLRQRLGLGYQVTTQWSLSIYDEVLGNIPNRYTHYVYDHNRIGANFNCQCNNHVKIDLGYVHIHRRQRNTDMYWQEENISLGFTYTL